MMQMFFIFILSISTRLYELTLRPLHHDESVNGWFVDQVFQNGFYKYDPSNYHGPLYFYVLTFFEWVFGRTEWALRMPTVLFGVAVSMTPFLFQKWIGKRAAFIAALIFALSPAEVFFSRYAIHEMGFALMQILFVFCWWKAYEASTGPAENVSRETKRWGLWLGVLFGALASTKENFVLFGAALFAADLAFLGIHRWKFWLKLTPWMLATSVPFIVVFYTGFFQHWDGIPQFFNAFFFWTKTGVVGNGHSKPFLYWEKILFGYEWAVGLGLIASAYYVWKGNKFQKWYSALGIVHLLAYSVVSYKTPWCVLVLIPPFALAAGQMIDFIWKNWPKYRIAVAPALGLLGFFTIAQMIEPNYRNPDSDHHPYIYGQTYRDFVNPIRDLYSKAEKDPKMFTDTKIMVISRFTWPLPWYLGQFKQVGYFTESNLPKTWNADYVFVDSNLKPKVAAEAIANKTGREVKSRQWAASMLVYEPNAPERTIATDAKDNKKKK